MKTQFIKLATRDSALAIKQAQIVAHSLKKCHPHLDIKIVKIKTQADKNIDILLSKMGGKGLFIKELEEALLKKKADIAVHSLKDMPTQLPDGLALPCVLNRGAQADVLVSEKYPSLAALGRASSIGTSSLRRSIQLKKLLPDANVIPIRGNLQTRLARLQQGKLDALVLAQAGLERLSEQKKIVHIFSSEEMLPAAGQGVIALEVRLEDANIAQLIAPLNHSDTFSAIQAERALISLLEGGCHAPIGAYAVFDNQMLSLTAWVGGVHSGKMIRAQARSMDNQPISLGQTVAQKLSDQGALDLLAEFKHTQNDNSP